MNRGVAWLTNGDHDRAIADYSDAIRLDPKRAYAYVSRGNVWLDKKDYDRALTNYNDAIKLDPKDASAYRSRGGVWFAKPTPIVPSRTIARRSATLRKMPASIATAVLCERRRAAICKWRLTIAISP